MNDDKWTCVSVSECSLLMSFDKKYGSCKTRERALS